MDVVKLTLFFAIFVISLPQLWAQENPTYFKWSGEYRTRYELLTPQAGQGSSALDIFSHRMIVEADFKPEESIAIKASLLLSENLGQDFRGYAGYTPTRGSQDSVAIYELYASWLSASGLSFKVGRFLYGANNENFFSKNLDDATPNRFDGGLLKYDKDYFNFEGGAFIVSQFQNANQKTETSRLYLVSVDLKLNQTLLQNLNLSFVNYDTNEKTYAEYNNFVFPEESLTMYMISLTGEYQRFFYSADVALQQGENVTTDQILDANMVHAKAGFRFSNSQRVKIYSQFHRDTGDKTDTPEHQEGYNPMFYNHFLNAGRMNLLGWGNLTSYGLGLSLHWSDNTNIALEYNRFIRTSVDDGVHGLSVTGTSPLVLDNSGTNSGPYNNSLNSQEKVIGDEIDLIVDFKSEYGLKFQSVTGLFQPNSYLKDYGKDKMIFFQRFGLEFFF